MAIPGPPRLDKLESILGYAFHDRDLLACALTHKSAGADNNERLEYLGDAVLGYLVASMLYESADAAEDTMTLMRASLVKRDTLAAVAQEIGLGDFVVLGQGEKRSGGHQRASILADAFEAVLGAMHQDGGLEPVRKLVGELFSERMDKLDHSSIKDSKTTLQELLQGKGLALPSYEVVDVSGLDHSRTFMVRCSVAAMDLVVDASGSSRRAAEQSAAAGMLQRISESE